MGGLKLYFSNIGDSELAQFHKTISNTFNITFEDALSSNLFKVENIINNKLYKLYPLFYSDSITSTNEEDEVLENKCIICNYDLNTLLIFEGTNMIVKSEDLEIGYYLYYTKYGFVFFTYNKIDGTPLSNVKINTLMQYTHRITGVTDETGLFYCITDFEIIDSSVTFMEFVIEYNGVEYNIIRD